MHQINRRRRFASCTTAVIVLVSVFSLGKTPAGTTSVGDLDVVFANWFDRNQLCGGIGDGTFSCIDVSTAAAPSLDVAVGDLDGDGSRDAVFANQLAPNEVCLGNGVGGFTCSPVSSAASHSSGVAVADVDDDGHLDALFANLAGSSQVCLGDGTGGLACTDVSSPPVGGQGVAIGDLDGNGTQDAVFALDAVCLGDGTGGFACSPLPNIPVESNDVALGDVDSDGDLDVVIAKAPGPNQVCLGDGTGTFTCTDITGAADLSFGVDVGDVNSDGDLDVVFAQDAVGLGVTPNTVCLGDGTGGFACSDLGSRAGKSRTVALADVNLDSHLDAIVGRIFGERNLVCLGDGGGLFSCSDVSNDGRNSYGVAVPSTETIEVDVDIMPGSFPNPINLRKKGVIPIAVLGSDTFVVTAIDVTTLEFAGAAPKHDLADAVVYVDHLGDVNSDGFADLVSHFPAPDTNISPGDIEACITGIADASTFIGCDSIQTAPPG